MPRVVASLVRRAGGKCICGTLCTSLLVHLGTHERPRSEAVQARLYVALDLIKVLELRRRRMQ